MSEGPSPHQRLEAAAHLKAIVESPGAFDPRHADAVATLLADLRPTFVSYTWQHTDDEGERTEGGIGNHELRCGAWVVEKTAVATTFTFRHVAADTSEPGSSYRLGKKHGTWRLARSHVCVFFGGRMTWTHWRGWKKAAR
jgi:hypothetical protein